MSEKGKLKKSEGVDLQELSIKSLGEEDTYKYLGIEEKNNIEHIRMRKQHKEGYVSTIKMILKTKLSSEKFVI